LAVFCLVSGLTLMAQTTASRRGEAPTPEHQALMRSNTAIVAVDGRGGVITGRLRDNLEADDFDAILEDVVALRENFRKIETFWVERNVETGITYARQGLTALTAIEAGAKARSEHAVGEAVVALATACRNCHLAHRVHVLSVPMRYEIR
jgi:cytochrome c556